MILIQSEILWRFSFLASTNFVLIKFLPVRQLGSFIFILLFNHVAFGQKHDVWIRFYDTVTERSGYKDLRGNIKIPAKFEGTRADSFYNIIAVDEKVDSSYKSYYLLKDGRKVGQDSVFMFDFMFDCESEGKIIFRDRKKDRVGFFDKNGIAIIPAIYNYVSSFRNGLAIAHRNAKRKCWEGDDTINCEHLGWEGGETILINEKNEILADSIKINLNNIDWYSKKENALQIDTSIYISIRGRNNKTYSFVDYGKEFKKWFNSTFLPSLKQQDAVIDLLFTEITFSSDEGWLSLKKKDFLNAFQKTLTPVRFDTNKLKDIRIIQDDLNQFIFESDLYKKYLNSCGDHNRDRFPLYGILITYYKKRNKPAEYITSGFFREYDTDYQENFEFFRSEKGFKLLSVSIKN